ncbi:hypothetical protein [Deinococcus knuensis]|uniref:Uncharacterized protein n=1 Tax=Deinococcus knuensis TaxID=1837380 RepID=A0ABQ2SH92_9DEIO|nr:hypothetical protein [Deinococcus knuensis]GGS26181.1 hypothetical protein GCM10008961_17150 [Deinococcus knuensis]
MLNHFGYMRSVFKNPSHGATGFQSSLLMTRHGTQSMVQYAREYGHWLTPAPVIGTQWRHTFVADGFAVAPERRIGRKTGPWPSEHQTYDKGWVNGYTNAVRQSGQEQIGWWFHREQPVHRRSGLTPIAIRGLFARSEWDDLPSYSNLQEHSMVLLTWVEHRTLCIYAVELKQETNEQRPMEVIWQERR